MSRLDHFYCSVETKIWSRLVIDKVSFEVFEVAECARSSMDRASDFGSKQGGIAQVVDDMSNPLCLCDFAQL